MTVPGLWVMVGGSMPPFDDDTWELCDGNSDDSQAHDLAMDQPDRLVHLQRLWLIEATKYNGSRSDDTASGSLALLRDLDRQLERTHDVAGGRRDARRPDDRGEDARRGRGRAFRVRINGSFALGDKPILRRHRRSATVGNEGSEL